MARNHALSAHIKQYAEETGLARRTAQLHAQKGNPRFKAWMAARCGAPSPPAKPRKPDPEEVKMTVEAALGDPMPERDYESLEAEMEARHEWLWRTNVTAAEKASAAGDLSTMLVCTKQAGEAAVAYRKAKEARIRADLESRRLVPAGEFESFRELVQRLAEMITRLDLDLPHLANPDNPDVAAAAVREWLTSRWNPFVLEVMEAAA